MQHIKCGQWETGRGCGLITETSNWTTFLGCLRWPGAGRLPPGREEGKEQEKEQGKEEG